MKRVLSLLLVAAMLLAIPVMPLTAQAATQEPNVTDPGSDCPCCGVPMDQLEWIPFDMKVIAFSSLFIVGCFFIIWIIMYVRNKREVKKLNELLHEEENRTEEE